MWRIHCSLAFPDICMHLIPKDKQTRSFVINEHQVFMAEIQLTLKFTSIQMHTQDKGSSKQWHLSFPSAYIGHTGSCPIQRQTIGISSSILSTQVESTSPGFKAGVFRSSVWRYPGLTLELLTCKLQPFPSLICLRADQYFTLLF